MKEFEFTFDKGLRGGLRKNASSPRDEQTLVECHNLMPAEAGLVLHEAVVGLNTDHAWGGRGKLADIVIPCEDAMLHGGSPTLNYNGGTIYIGDDAPYRGIIRFKPNLLIPAALSDSISVAKIYLYLYEKTGSGTHTVSAYRVLQNWVENQVTYNRYKVGSNWSTAGCAAASDAGVDDDSSYDRLATREAYHIISSGTPAWYYWTVTDLCKEWVAGTAEEYGVLLQSNNEANDEYLRFYSSQWAGATELPYLSITWS